VARPEWEAEFVAYVEGRMVAVRRLAYGLCGDWHTAEDLAQSIPYAVAVAAATLAVRARGPRRLAAASVLAVATVAISAVLLSLTAHQMALGLAAAAALVGLGAAVARRLSRTERTPRTG